MRPAPCDHLFNNGTGRVHISRNVTLVTLVKNDKRARPESRLVVARANRRNASAAKARERGTKEEGFPHLRSGGGNFHSTLLSLPPSKAGRKASDRTARINNTGNMIDRLSDRQLINV